MRRREEIPLDEGSELVEVKRKVIEDSDNIESVEEFVDQLDIADKFESEDGEPKELEF